MEHISVICECGCGHEAEWLCWGVDYDPAKPDGHGQRFETPACYNAMMYLEESADSFGLPFEKEPLT